MEVQKRLPPRLRGCLAPRPVEGPGTILLPSSESLELEAACLAFFEAEGRACGGERSEDTHFLAGLWSFSGSSEPDVELSVFFLSTGAGEQIFGGCVSVVGSFRIRYS